MRARPALVERGQVGALDPDRAGRRGVEAAGQGQERRLAGAGRTHHGDELAGVGAEGDAAQGVHLGRALAVDARDGGEVEDGVHRGAPSVALAAVAVPVRTSPRSTAARRSLASQWSSQRTSASASKTSESRTRLQARSAESCGRRGAAGALEAGVVLERGHRGAALALDDRADVDAGQRHGDRELDRELVARRLGARHRRGEPLRHLAPPGLGGAVDVRAVGSERFADTPVPGVPAPFLVNDDLDQSVTLEAGQGRVDLPDVERPGLPRPLLELRPELVAVHRPLLQDRQHRLPDRHPRLRVRPRPRERWIPGMYTTYAWVDVGPGLGESALGALQRPPRGVTAQRDSDAGDSDGGDGQHDPRPLGGREPAAAGADGGARSTRPGTARATAGGSQAHGVAATPVNSIAGQGGDQRELAGVRRHRARAAPGWRAARRGRRRRASGSTTSSRSRAPARPPPASRRAR